jgi:hypothetical protein
MLHRCEQTWSSTPRIATLGSPPSSASRRSCFQRRIRPPDAAAPMRRAFHLRISVLLLQMLDLVGDVAPGLGIKVEGKSETAEQRDGKNNSS